MNTPITMNTRAIILAGAIALGFGARAQAEDQRPELPGYDRLQVEAPHRGRPIEGAIWYPAGRATYKSAIGRDVVFRGTEALVGAAAQEGRHPLIVFSHGSGGNMDNMGWLLSGLAQNGAIVLAVNHPGSTSGDSSPRRSIRLWERPQDISAALDHLLADPAWVARIDPGRISAMGFSMGGATALALAGVEIDLKLYADYCDSVGEAAMDCLFWARGGVDMRAVESEAGAKALADPRISATVAVDPGMGFGFTAGSVAAVDQPVMLLTLGAERPIALDVSPAGNDLARRLPGAVHEEIAAAWHFSFLGLCTEAAPAILADAGEDPICEDPEGVDRAAVHAEAITRISAFLGLE